MVMDRILSHSVSPRTSGRLSHSSDLLNGSLTDNTPISPSEIQDIKVNLLLVLTLGSWPETLFDSSLLAPVNEFEISEPFRGDQFRRRGNEPRSHAAEARPAPFLTNLEKLDLGFSSVQGEMPSPDSLLQSRSLKYLDLEASEAGLVSGAAAT
ncbi:unnamed protein product [Linum trigynum]|uniref:Uncharacterized protein n=1 Tax=Linum trigynum TaxID=586398 RepID=A0AAV2GNW0_9ROSI